MWRFVHRLAATLVCLALSAPAFAQTTITVTNCARPTYALTVGAAGNGDKNGTKGTFPRNRSGAALDFGASLHLPVGDFTEIRVDAGSVAWAFQSRDSSGAPLVRETVLIQRATLTTVRLERHQCSPVRLMTGFGIGAYAFQFDESRATKLGLHVLGAMDVEVSDRAAITAEVALHAIDGPDRPPVSSVVLFAVRAGFGVRFRF